VRGGVTSERSELLAGRHGNYCSDFATVGFAFEYQVRNTSVGGLHGPTKLR
jgi:hypothetical protein